MPDALPARPDARIVLTTAADPGEAARLARALVEERLAACATPIPARKVRRLSIELECGYHEYGRDAVAAYTYESALQIAESLSRDEQLRLIQELTAHAGESPASEPQHSILELRGLGKEIWEGIDAQEYVRNERASWNG